MWKKFKLFLHIICPFLDLECEAIFEKCCHKCKTKRLNKQFNADPEVRSN